MNPISRDYSNLTSVSRHLLIGLYHQGMQGNYQYHHMRSWMMQQRTFGDSVSLVAEKDHTAEDKPGILPEKHFWTPSSKLLNPPLDGPSWPVPDA